MMSKPHATVELYSKHLELEVYIFIYIYID